MAAGRSWNQADAVRVRARCNELVALLPQTVVEDAYGHTSYLLGKKRYAWLLVDHHGDGRLALWVKAPKGEQDALVGADANRYFVPPYLGPSGWVGRAARRRIRPGLGRGCDAAGAGVANERGEAVARDLRRRARLTLVSAHQGGRSEMTSNAVAYLQPSRGPNIRATDSRISSAGGQLPPNPARYWEWASSERTPTAR